MWLDCDLAERWGATAAQQTRLGHYLRLNSLFSLNLGSELMSGGERAGGLPAKLRRPFSFPARIRLESSPARTLAKTSTAIEIQETSTMTNALP